MHTAHSRCERTSTQTYTHTSTTTTTMDKIRLYFIIALTILAVMLMLWFLFCFVFKCGCCQSCNYRPCTILYARYYYASQRMRTSQCCIRFRYCLHCRWVLDKDRQRPPPPPVVEPLPGLVSIPYLMRPHYNDSVVASGVIVEQPKMMLKDVERY